ncbi:MAG: DinB family protein [Pyrinomonadaceae bacterium]
MNYNNVGEIFEAIETTREKFKQKISTLTDEQTKLRENGQGWMVVEIVEHIGIVESGINLIAAKLLAQAESEGKKSDGVFNPPILFAEKIASIQDRKLEAPERVHPQGKQTIAESLTKLDENRRALNNFRPRIEAVDLSNATFPHPFLGDLNLYEWLIMTGLHERRHLRQIENILA